MKETEQESQGLGLAVSFIVQETTKHESHFTHQSQTFYTEWAFSAQGENFYQILIPKHYVKM